MLASRTSLEASAPKPPNPETEVTEGPKAQGSSGGQCGPSRLLTIHLCLSAFRVWKTGRLGVSPIFLESWRGRERPEPLRREGPSWESQLAGPSPPLGHSEGAAPSGAEQRGLRRRQGEGDASRCPRGTADTLSSLTVHALERQESSALLHLYILLEGEGELLQPSNDLLHLPSPKPAQDPAGGPYIAPCPRCCRWRPLKGHSLVPPPLIPGGASCQVTAKRLSKHRCLTTPT